VTRGPLLALLVAAGACDHTPAVPVAPDCGSVADIEERIILPRCGAPGDGSCHATGSAPPRMAEVGRIAENLLEVRGLLRCHKDAYVSRNNPEQSYILAKIRSTGASASCSDGSNGGPRMPYQDAPPLTAAEAACLERWVHEIAR